MERRLWRIGLWCAVSSKAQAADDRISLEEQERLGREFAQNVGGEVVAIYRVPGHSRDLWRWDDAEQQMDAYRELRTDVEAGKLDVLYCVESDRLGRDPALVQQVISLVERAGGEVYRENRAHTLGQKSISDRYLDAFDSVSASQEEKKRQRRHRMGMKGRIEKRGLLPGSPPFYLEAIHAPGGGAIGYTFSDQVGALDLMTDLFLRGYSYEEIRRRLTASRYPPPGNSRQWWHDTVHSTLNSDVPAGLPSWGIYRASEPSDKFPARWDEATHQAVVNERRRRALGYHRRGASPLYAVALCGRCGGRMGRHWATNVNAHYLRCLRHASSHDCHSNAIQESKVLAEVGRFLQWLTGDGVIDQVLSEQGDSNEVEQMKRDLARARSAVDDLEARKIRVGHAFAAGDMEIPVYRKVNADLTDQVAEQQARILKLSRALDAVPDLDQRRATLEDLSRNFPALLATLDAPEVAAMLQSAGLHVYIEDRKVQRISIE